MEALSQWACGFVSYWKRPIRVTGQRADSRVAPIAHPHDDQTDGRDNQAVSGLMSATSGDPTTGARRSDRRLGDQNMDGAGAFCDCGCCEFRDKPPGCPLTHGKNGGGLRGESQHESGAERPAAGGLECDFVSERMKGAMGQSGTCDPIDCDSCGETSGDCCDRHAGRKENRPGPCLTAALVLTCVPLPVRHVRTWTDGPTTRHTNGDRLLVSLCSTGVTSHTLGQESTFHSLLMSSQRQQLFHTISFDFIEAAKRFWSSRLLSTS